MPQIYVIYRPEDTRKKSQEILETLKKTYGAFSIKSPNFEGYVDVYQIEGDVQKTDFLLVVIGNYWADLVDESGVNLLRSVYDPVHMAIATAIQSRKRIIPILVDGASMPHRTRLPRELRALASQDPIKLEKNGALSKSLNKGLKDIIKRDSLVKVPDFIAQAKIRKRPTTSISNSRRLHTQIPQQNWQHWFKRTVLPTATLIIIALAMVIINIPDNNEAPVADTSDPFTPVLATIAPTSTATTMIQSDLTATENPTTILTQSRPQISVDNAGQLTLSEPDMVSLTQPALVVFSEDRSLFIFVSPELQEIQIQDINSGINLKTITTAPNTPRAIQLNEDETLLHVLLNDGQILAWGIES